MGRRCGVEDSVKSLNPGHCLAVAGACLLVALMTGCAWRTEIPPEANDFVAVSGGKLRASVQFKLADEDPAITEKLRKSRKTQMDPLVEKTIAQCGLFSVAEADLRNPDVNIEITMKSTSGGMGVAAGIISGITLFLFPTWLSNTVEMTARVETPTKEPLGEYTAQGKAWAVMHVLLLPCCPSLVIVDIRQNEDNLKSLAVQIARNERLQAMQKAASAVR